jgi:hypothetical protein
MPGLTELVLSATRIRPSPFSKRMVYSSLLRTLDAPKSPWHPSRLLAALRHLAAGLPAPPTKHNGARRK